MLTINSNISLKNLLVILSTTVALVSPIQSMARDAGSKDNATIQTNNTKLSSNTNINKGDGGGLKAPGFPDDPGDNVGWEFAFSGYVCRVKPYVVSSGRMNIETQIYSEPSCQGEPIGILKTCQMNILDRSCFAQDDPVAEQGTYPVYMMPAMLDNLVQALKTGVKLVVYRSIWSISDFGENFGQRVAFTAYP